MTNKIVTITERQAREKEEGESAGPGSEELDTGEGTRTDGSSFHA